MSDKVTISSTGSIAKSIQGMLTRSKKMQGWLNTVAYREYQNAQRARWMSEGASQGSKWAALDSKYKETKLVKFAAYPGSGTKTLFATGRLYDSVVGPSPEHRKLTTTTSITILSAVQYASYVDQDRQFTNWDPEFGRMLSKKAMQYMRGK